MNNFDPIEKLQPPLKTPPSEICSCTGTRPIKIMSSLSFNPLHCIDCNLEVAPESLNLSLEMIEEIASFRDIYYSIDLLWLDSGEYEAWALLQLSDIHSPVNRRGLELCQRVNHLRCCYYWYKQDQSADDFVPITHCPQCGQPLVEYKEGIFVQLICEQCRIITVGE